MPEEPPVKLHVDSDWKTEAAREKERLAEQEARREPDAEAWGGPPTFADLVNLIAMQALVGLGGLRGPGGETIPPNLIAAKHHIDLLDLLERKTQGQLTEDEKRDLARVIYELRMHFVQATARPLEPPPPAAR
jgi:hypothetical protein